MYIKGSNSPAIPIGFAGVVDGSCGYAATYCRVAYYALSSVSEWGGSTGLAVPVSEAADSSNDIILPSYPQYEVSIIFTNGTGVLELKLVDFVLLVEVWEA